MILYQWESLLEKTMRRIDIIFFFSEMPLYRTTLFCTIIVGSKLTTTYSDINVLILDYLTMEGYPNAAAKFSKEANLAPHQDIASIKARQDIQTCIYSGNIQSAIETLNELDPEVSSFFPSSHFPAPHMIRTRVLHAPRLGQHSGQC